MTNMASRCLFQGKHGHVNAQWPPLGYNLIIGLPMKAEEFAPQWVPAATAAPTQIGMPQSAHIQQPLPVVQAQVVQAQVVQNEAVVVEANQPEA